MVDEVDFSGVMKTAPETLGMLISPGDDRRRLDVLLYFHWLSGLMFVGAAGVTAPRLVRASERQLYLQLTVTEERKPNAPTTGSVTALPETDTTPSAKRRAR